MCNSNLNTERTLFRSMHTWMMDRWIGRAGSIFSWAEGRANNLFVWLQIRRPKYLHARRRGRTDADRARIATELKTSPSRQRMRPGTAAKLSTRPRFALVEPAGRRAVASAPPARGAPN
jgi:hypothetical protein